MKKSYFNIFIFNLVFLIAVPIPFAEAMYGEETPELTEEDLSQWSQQSNQRQAERKAAEEEAKRELAQRRAEEEAAIEAQTAASNNVHTVIDGRSPRIIAAADDTVVGDGEANNPGKVFKIEACLKEVKAVSNDPNEDIYCKVEQEDMKYSCELDDGTLKTLGLKDKKDENGNIVEANNAEENVGKFLQKNRYICAMNEKFYNWKRK